MKDEAARSLEWERGKENGNGKWEVARQMDKISDQGDRKLGKGKPNLMDLVFQTVHLPYLGYPNQTLRTIVPTYLGRHHSEFISH